MHKTISVALGLCLAGCSPQASAPARPTVAMVPYSVAQDAQVALATCKRVFGNRLRSQEELLRAERKEREAYLGRLGEGEDATWKGMLIRSEADAERQRLQIDAMYRTSSPECFGD